MVLNSGTPHHPNHREREREKDITFIYTNSSSRDASIYLNTFFPLVQFDEVVVNFYFQINVINFRFANEYQVKWFDFLYNKTNKMY